MSQHVWIPDSAKEDVARALDERAERARAEAAHAKRKARRVRAELRRLNKPSDNHVAGLARIKRKRRKS